MELCDKIQIEIQNYNDNSSKDVKMSIIHEEKEET